MSGPVVRPLPPRPDLEFERKQAKQLLREVRRGDPDALTRIRAQNRSLASAAPDAIKLADSQLAIAREYGFRSWPLLVRYYETFARHQRSNIRRNEHDKEFTENWARGLIKENRDRRLSAALMFGSFVPRFYGASVEEIFASDVTEAEARLVVARSYGFGSWNDLLDAAPPARDAWKDAQMNPIRQMSRAMNAGDLDTLQRLVTEHPELRTAGNGPVTHLGFNAAHFHFQSPSPASRAILDWVTSIGIDIQTTLNYQLLGRFGVRGAVAEVQRLLDAGANPAWVAPNGYSVLEHAIHRYWNGDSVDLIASRVKPRDTFWVAAGIGDAVKMRRYFDRSGKLNAKARRERPDLTALSGHAEPSMPEPDDNLILWEAAFAAAVNGRGEAFDVLLEHGFPIDFSFGMTLLSFAAGNGLLPMVELLVKRGASPHVRGYRPSMTALELAAEMFAQRPADDTRRRILELLGGDPVTTLRDHDAKRQPPQAIPDLRRSLAAAAQDAHRRGQKDVGLENVFVGMLRKSEMILSALSGAGVDLARLRGQFAARLSDDPPPPSPEVQLPPDDALRTVIEAATADAFQRRDGIMTWTVLLEAVKSDEGPVSRLIREGGGDLARLRQIMGRYYG